MPVALITGITGQDGSFLAEQLLELGWSVFGMIRRSASPNHWRIHHLKDKLTLLDGDLTDLASIMRVMAEVKPDHIYNLASQSYVATSWKQPLLTGDVTGQGAVRMLEAMRLVCPDARFYQASSSEIFGLQPTEQLLNENSPLHPRSPYGCAKAYAHHMAINYRESYGLHVVSGILFNHESERRGEEFVTRKISKAVAAIAAGQQSSLKLGDISVCRDWGFAGDYTKAIHLLLSHDEPLDLVIATGQAHSVQDFLNSAFNCVGLNWEDWVEHDPTLIRPADIPMLCGDSRRAQNLLSWKPSVNFDALVKRMVEADCHRLQQNRNLSGLQQQYA
ncbi:MAG: GDP-mannose 4,6-dehydratase [Myxococcota bacterium]|nr:GDP-mannose 4,6-dehydratase [Myxococcota bacterium]